MPVVEFRNTENQKAGKHDGSKPVINNLPGDPVSQAILTIETASIKDQVITEASQRKETIDEVSKPLSTKLGALSKIRQQYSKSNGIETEIIVKTLTTEELQSAWNNYSESLRETKNHAAQSFERASFNIVNNNFFEVVSNNNLELKFIEQQRLSLNEHLQVWFNNKALSYTLLIKDKPEPTEKFDVPLNSREQFQKLADQYPLVRELKDRLRLELDY